MDERRCEAAWNRERYSPHPVMEVLDRVIHLILKLPVHNIIQKIGYPTKSPDIGDPEALRNYYAPVNITESTYFDNALSMAQGHVTRMWAKAGKPTDRDSWVMSVPTVNVCLPAQYKKLRRLSL